MSQAVFDGLKDNERFCVICRNDFQLNNLAAVFACCNLLYHVECASMWFNHSSRTERGGPQRYVTCALCTARWERRMVTDILPNPALEQLPGIKDGESGLLRIQAGIPPSSCLLLHAATCYGRHGLAVALYEILGTNRSPMSLEDAISLWHDLTEQFRRRVRPTLPEMPR